MHYVLTSGRLHIFNIIYLIYDLCGLFSLLEDDTRLQKCDPLSILNSSKLSLKACDVVLEIGPFRVTLYDLWSTLQPGTLSASVEKQIKDEVPRFVPGWLADTVSTIGLLYVIKLELHKNYTVFEHYTWQHDNRPPPSST